MRSVRRQCEKKKLHCCSRAWHTPVCSNHTASLVLEPVGRPAPARLECGRVACGAWCDLALHRVLLQASDPNAYRIFVGGLRKTTLEEPKLGWCWVLGCCPLSTTCEKCRLLFAMVQASSCRTEFTHTLPDLERSRHGAACTLKLFQPLLVSLRSAICFLDGISQKTLAVLHSKHSLASTLPLCQ